MACLKYGRGLKPNTMTKITFLAITIGLLLIAALIAHGTIKNIIEARKQLRELRKYTRK